MIFHSLRFNVGYSEIKRKYVQLFGNIHFHNLSPPCFRNISLTKEPSNDEMNKWPHDAPWKMLSTFWLREIKWFPKQMMGRKSVGDNR
jgi:hypothetical protein